MQQLWDQYWRSRCQQDVSRAGWSKRRIIEVLERYVRPSMAVLDAGCGTGFFSLFFHASGCQVSCLDYSEEALAITRRVTRGACCAYLKRDLLVPGTGAELQGRFDLIFSDGLLEHFELTDQRCILDSFRRMARPGGLIVTVVPNRYSWWQLVRPLVMPGIQENAFTWSRFARLISEQTALESGGLNVIPFRWSPDRQLGTKFGMLLYCVGRYD